MKFTALVICSAFMLATGGCGQRTLTITSQPAGALVYLNGEEVGRTPMKYDFDNYGDYDVTLRKEGYQTLKTHRDLKAPLYAWPPLDLFADMFGAKDRREWTFELAPAEERAADPQELIARGIATRDELRSSKYTRVPATQPTTQPVPATQPAD